MNENDILEKIALTRVFLKKYIYQPLIIRDMILRGNSDLNVELIPEGFKIKFKKSETKKEVVTRYIKSVMNSYIDMMRPSFVTCLHNSEYRDSISSRQINELCKHQLIYNVVSITSNQIEILL